MKYPALKLCLKGYDIKDNTRNYPQVIYLKRFLNRASEDSIMKGNCIKMSNTLHGERRKKIKVGYKNKDFQLEKNRQREIITIVSCCTDKIKNQTTCETLEKKIARLPLVD